MIDEEFQPPVYQTLPSVNVMISPQVSSPSLSYATLTPLQSQAINSVNSDSFTYVHDGNVSGSCIVIQKNSLNNLEGVISLNEMTTSPPHISSPNNVLNMSQYCHLSPQSSYSHNVPNYPETSFTGNMNWPPTLGGVTTIDVLTTITPHTVLASPAPAPAPLPQLSYSPPSVVQGEAVEVATPSPPMLTNTPTLQDASPLNSSGDTGASQAYEQEQINTKELVQWISDELKRHSIPQEIFAKRVLCRSQGTLSELLRNPKPWSKLKHGRGTFRKMLKWLQEPESQRMSLRLEGESMDGEAHPIDCKGNQVHCSVTAQILQRDTYKKKEKPHIHPEHMATPKNSRVVFTDLQFSTLRAIFKETEWPTKQMKEVIARQLGLEVTTVDNFFLNARQRPYKWKDNDSTKTAFTLSTGFSPVAQHQQV